MPTEVVASVIGISLCVRTASSSFLQISVAFSGDNSATFGSKSCRSTLERFSYRFGSASGIGVEKSRHGDVFFEECRDAFSSEIGSGIGAISPVDVEFDAEGRLSGGGKSFDFCFTP